ncbi:hypothetical protein [Streptomyces sp. TRM70350]|uniref:hypothetical protein n=1 Tax=Streptomyces sp. TRM70350 TaxID=2856165 RepID=UPI001C454CA3|nr:hypothetical protein [Streptomyces sp. TRM70350]MBV7698234.1 hypothetical protein [Streptomyces sp. TRM70350]
MEDVAHQENQPTLADGLRVGIRALVHTAVGGTALIALATVASVLGPVPALDLSTPPVVAW